MINPYVLAVHWVLDTVVARRDFFEKNPKCLAYMFMFHDEMHYASRHDTNHNRHDWTNPKYAILELEEEVGKEYGDLIYDAWATQIRTSESRLNVLPLEGKVNKTLDDWVKIKTNPKYEYHSLFPNRKRVLSYLLCTIGNGSNWNKDGFLSEIGPAGIDQIIFFGYQDSFKDLPEDIQEKINEYYADKTVAKGVKKFRSVIEESKNERIALRASHEQLLKTLEKTDGGKNLAKKLREEDSRRTEERLSDVYYPLSEGYSSICVMPANAHISYVLGALEVCDEILADPRESKENKKIAKKYLSKLKKRGVLREAANEM